MTMLAMWFQETYTFSSENEKLLLVFVGLVAASMTVQAIVIMVAVIKTAKAVKQMTATVDELKAKALPIIETAKDIGHTVQRVVNDNAPKVTHITDNLVETSTVSEKFSA